MGRYVNNDIISAAVRHGSPLHYIVGLDKKKT